MITFLNAAAPLCPRRININVGERQAQLTIERSVEKLLFTLHAPLYRSRIILHFSSAAFELFRQVFSCLLSICGECQGLFENVMTGNLAR
jgi:hypothetical protein